MQRKDLTGQIFHKLTALQYGKSKYNPSRPNEEVTAWICLCECGNKKNILTSSLLSGNTKSCYECSYWRYKQQIQQLNNICGIYKIINPITNQEYIGSSVDIGSRLKRHCSDFKNGTKLRANKSFQKDWENHNHDKQLWEMICIKEFKNTEKELQKMMIEEAQLITSSKNVYNYIKISPEPKLSKKDKENFWNRVDKSQGENLCWNWIDDTNETTRYGHFYKRENNKTIKTYAHKLAYYLIKGQWVVGLCLCHTCDNTKCVNPKHLKPRSSRYNAQDRVNKDRHHKCKSRCTNEQLQEMKQMRMEGSTYSEIANRFNCSNTHIPWLFKKNNIDV